MARYASDHKDATRRRILDAAGRRFKRDGVDGAGIAAVMTDAGLTNGAFYAHFSSKDDLVAHVVADQVQQQRQRGGADLAAPEGLTDFVRAYLSREHRDDVSSGCPSAALLQDIARGSVAARRTYGDELMITIDEIADLVEAPDPRTARRLAMSLFASMVGILQLARALPDELADDLLEQGAYDILERARQLVGPRGPAARSEQVTS